MANNKKMEEAERILEQMLQASATIHVKGRLLTECLGTCPNNPEIYRDFIGSKAEDAKTVEEEINDLGADVVADRGMTVFLRDEVTGRPYIKAYQIKGYFKDACGVLRMVKGTKSSKLTAYKKKIDGLVFPMGLNDNLGEKIFFDFEGETGECQRSLRADTPQGPRTSLACSETIPAGATFQFDVECMDKEYVPLVLEWLSYGQYRGLLQWRNSGKGRFEILECDVETGINPRDPE